MTIIIRVGAFSEDIVKLFFPESVSDKETSFQTFCSKEWVFIHRFTPKKAEVVIPSVSAVGLYCPAGKTLNPEY